MPYPTDATSAGSAALRPTDSVAAGCAGLGILMYLVRFDVKISISMYYGHLHICRDWTVQDPFNPAED